MNRELLWLLIEKVLRQLDNNRAGVISEHSAVMHMIDHIHREAGTFNSPQRLVQRAHHQAEIDKLAEGFDPKQVAVRVNHGRYMADTARRYIKIKYGNKAPITRVAHTSKPGNIPEFTNNKHMDGQENPSDFAVEVKKGNQPVYEGFSCKSAKKAKKVNARNPSVNFHGALDTKSRTLNTKKISEKGLKKARAATVSELKLDKKYPDLDLTNNSHRKKAIDRARKEEKVEKYSSIEKTANEHALGVKDDLVDEFHTHVNHLLKNEPNGHKMVRDLLRTHLSPNITMPCSKIHVRGDPPEPSLTPVGSNSDSPLSKILNNPKSRFAASKTKSKVTIHHIAPDGTSTVLAHYAPKTTSNAFKSGHQWTVLPGEIH